MKKLLSCVILSILVFWAVACGSYTPEQKDFELFVQVGKTEAEAGSSIPYSIRVTRKGGKAFTCKGSSTLCSTYFEVASPEKEPYFTRSDDLVVHKFPEVYQYEEDGSLRTANLPSGTYLFAVRFFIGELTYDFRTEIALI